MVDSKMPLKPPRATRSSPRKEPFLVHDLMGGRDSKPPIPTPDVNGGAPTESKPAKFPNKLASKHSRLTMTQRLARSKPGSKIPISSSPLDFPRIHPRKNRTTQRSFQVVRVRKFPPQPPEGCILVAGWGNREKVRLCHLVGVLWFRHRAVEYAVTAHPGLKPREADFGSTPACRTIIRQGHSLKDL